MEHLELLVNGGRKTCGSIYKDVQVWDGESGRCEGKESKSPSHIRDSIRIHCPTATAGGVTTNRIDSFGRVVVRGFFLRRSRIAGVPEDGPEVARCAHGHKEVPDEVSVSEPFCNKEHNFFSVGATP